MATFNRLGFASAVALLAVARPGAQERTPLATPDAETWSGPAATGR